MESQRGCRGWPVAQVKAREGVRSREGDGGGRVYMEGAGYESDVLRVDDGEDSEFTNQEE